MIRFERVTNEIEKEVNRLANGLQFKDLIKFEKVLIVQFAGTQAKVHVITGSLKLSGRVSSGAPNGNWEGSISYGGKSSGIHNPVDYAEYEREREGRHDFLAPARDLDSKYIDAVMEFLEG